MTYITTELSYIKRLVFKKVIQQQNEWNFDLEVLSRTGKPVFVIEGFEERDRLKKPRTKKD